MLIKVTNTKSLHVNLWKERPTAEDFRAAAANGYHRNLVGRFSVTSPNVLTNDMIFTSTVQVNVYDKVANKLSSNVNELLLDASKHHDVTFRDDLDLSGRLRSSLMNKPWFGGEGYSYIFVRDGKVLSSLAKKHFALKATVKNISALGLVPGTDLSVANVTDMLQDKAQVSTQDVAVSIASSALIWRLAGVQHDRMSSTTLVGVYSSAITSIQARADTFVGNADLSKVPFSLHGIIGYLADTSLNQYEAEVVEDFFEETRFVSQGNRRSVLECIYFDAASPIYDIDDNWLKVEGPNGGYMPLARPVDFNRLAQVVETALNKASNALFGENNPLRVTYSTGHPVYTTDAMLFNIGIPE